MSGAAAPKLWYAPAAAALLCFGLGPALAHFKLTSALQGFQIFLVSGLFGALGAVWSVWTLRHGAPRRGLISLGLCLVPLVTISFCAAKNRQVPRLNDVSTDLDNPPRFSEAAKAPENAGRDLSYPEPFKAQVREGYPELLSLQLPEAATLAFARVKQVAAAMPNWTVLRTDEQTLTLEGTETAGIFRFTDDFVVRVEPLDDQAQVNMRSRSRVGKGDFGANAARIRSFFAALQAADGDATKTTP